MSRLIPHRDMSTEDLLSCSYQAIAILHLCDSAAWAIQNGSGAPDLLAGSIGTAMRLAVDLLEPVHDALEIHEGLKGGE